MGGTRNYIYIYIYIHVYAHIHMHTYMCLHAPVHTPLCIGWLQMHVCLIYFGHIQVIWHPWFLIFMALRKHLKAVAKALVDNRMVFAILYSIYMHARTNWFIFICDVGGRLIPLRDTRRDTDMLRVLDNRALDDVSRPRSLRDSRRR